MKALKSKLEFTYEVARQAMDMSHLKNKDRYDKGVKEALLVPGDRVLVKNVGIRGPHKLSSIWLPHVYKVLQCVGGNPRVYEVQSVSHPRRKNRVLHIDMLKSINDLERKHARTHVPGYEKIQSVLDECDDLALGKLFDDDAGSKSTIPSPKLGKSKALKDRRLKRKAYNLRSRMLKEYPEGSPAVTVSDSDVVPKSSSEDEMMEDGGLKPQHQLDVPKHASSCDDLSSDRNDESGKENHDIIVSESSGHATDEADVKVDDVPFGIVTPCRENDETDGSIDEVVQNESAVSIDEETEKLEGLCQPETLTDKSYADSSSSEDCAQSESSPAGIGRRLPARQRSKPSWYGDVFSHVLWGSRPSKFYGQVTHL